MRKLLITLSIVVVIATALTFAWPYIVMEFAGSAHYTEQDKREYEFYTPDILKKMPRIAPHFSFDFDNITGPASHVYAVKFFDTKDTNKIENYLISQGYSQHKCDFEVACWRSDDPAESIYVGIFNDEKTVIVQVVYNFT